MPFAISSRWCSQGLLAFAVTFTGYVGSASAAVSSPLSIAVEQDGRGVPAAIAQQPSPQQLPQVPLPPLEEPRSEPPPPSPEPIPSPEELLQTPTGPGVAPSPALEVPGTIVVTRFIFAGNTAFSDQVLQAAVADYIGRPITFNQLLEARTAVTQLYVDAGYINSGAFIPAEQRITNGEVVIQVVEGRLEAINIEGLGRLNPDYIRSRINVRAGVPLNVNRLVEALQLLQLDPLIAQLSAELAAGTTTGGSVLNLEVTEADVVAGIITLDNSRSPLVGSFRRRLSFTHGNLAGQGDRFSVGYSNTDGSNSLDLSYAHPFNPYNGTVQLLYSGSRSRVIEPAFAPLNIESRSDEVELGVRQPIYQTPGEEVALGLSLSYNETGSTFKLGNFPREPFPSEGADANGETRITALRFSQEWTQRGASQVLALRSQITMGGDWFGATVNDGDVPDSNFFSWQAQAQYVRIFQDNSLLLLRLSGQLADRPLLSSERFRLGGQDSVRGYRQDLITTDNGLLASAEMRFPVLSIPESNSAMQIAPFLDYGLGWNAGGGGSQSLLSLGAGMIWQFGDRVNARLDYAIPLIDLGPKGNSLQEQGLLFTLSAEVF